MTLRQHTKGSNTVYISHIDVGISLNRMSASTVIIALFPLHYDPEVPPQAGANLAGGMVKEYTHICP